MDKKDIKDGVTVVDRWSPELGTGIITEVKKTVFNVDFGGNIIKYDYPHSQFLDMLDEYIKFYIDEAKGKYKTKKEIIDNTHIVLYNRGVGVTKKHIRELLNKND